MKNLAVFVSGSGSNAENLITHFRAGNVGRVTVVFSNKKDIFALERAKRLGVPSLCFNRDDFYNSDKILTALREQKIDFIVLAGFLWLVPQNIVDEYRNRIVNIHPALLPKFGGKGMFGMHVHESVVESGETESGITIHYVNGRYDEGDCIFQAKVPVTPSDTPEDVAEKIHGLEYKHFPAVVEQLLIKL